MSFLLRFKRARTCKATTGTAFEVRGRSHFRCERGPRHEGPHERTSPPLRARWTETGDTRVFEYAETI